jgi:hypothetical protein
VVVVVTPGGSVVVVVGAAVVVVVGPEVVVVVGPLVVVVVVVVGAGVVVVVVVGGPTLVSNTETETDTVGTTPFSVKVNISVPSHVLSSLKKKVATAVLLITVNDPPSPEIFASDVSIPVMV